MEPENQDIIGKSNTFFQHILSFKQVYLLVIAFIVLTIPVMVNGLKGYLPIMGKESYFHLSQAGEINSVLYNALKVGLGTLPDSALAAVPILLGLASVVLFLRLAKKILLPEGFTFFFALFVIISPAFILTYTTVSSMSVFITLLLIGLVLLVDAQRRRKYFALIPFALATQIDIASTLLLLVILAVYFIVVRREYKVLALSPLGVAIILLFANLLILSLPFAAEPFNVQSHIQDIFADLGGLSGVSIFLAITAIIGIIFTWRRKNHYIAYILLPIVLLLYVFTAQMLFPLTILIAFFATVGFIQLFESTWHLATLKRFTFLLLLLGILFTSMTFMARMDVHSFETAQADGLVWIQETTGASANIFTLEESKYLSEYYSTRDTFSEHDLKGILDVIYVNELFPILEEYEITHIYLTQEMKASLPQETGLLFLLKNERFKLAYQRQGVEVWTFT